MKRGRRKDSLAPKPSDFEFVEQYFWACVRRTNNCWIWTGPTRSKDYGIIRPFSKTGQQEGVHRYSYQLHYGKFNRSLQVCHTCDNPSCVRPDHLFLGTNADNQIDSLQKGRARFNPLKGSQTHLNVSEKIREEILSLRKRKLSYKLISEHVNISKWIVRRIILGGGQ